MLEQIATTGLAMQGGLAAVKVAENIKENVVENSGSTTPSFVLPGAEYQNPDRPEANIDNPDIKTGVFRTQNDYNMYLRGQGLSAGGNYDGWEDMHGPSARGELSVEDQQAVAQAFATGDPIIDKGDGWYSMVYSGDGTNSMDSARVLPTEYKANGDGSFNIRGDSPESYVTYDKHGIMQPADPYDYQAWLDENPQGFGGSSNPLVSYARDCAESQHEITVYPDPRNSAQMNPTLLQGIKDHESRKQMSSAGNVLEAESTGVGVSMTNEDVFKNNGSAALGGAALGSFGVAGQQIIQLLRELLNKMEQQFGDGAVAGDKNATNEYQQQSQVQNQNQVQDEQREIVATGTVDTSYAQQAQGDITFA